MAKQKSEFVSGFDIAALVFKAFANAVMDAGGTGEDIRRIETDSNLRKQIGELVVKGRKAADGIVCLLVNYTQPLLNMIKACGFDWVNDNITAKNFPINQRPNGEVEMKIFHFNRTIGSDEAIQEMEKEGFRPAELPEGLAYAKANPEEQRKYPIVLLGSVWQYLYGRRDVPCLDGGGAERGLHLGWCARGWDSRCRFLAVRK